MFALCIYPLAIKDHADCSVLKCTDISYCWFFSICPESCRWSHSQTCSMNRLSWSCYTCLSPLCTYIGDNVAVMSPFPTPAHINCAGDLAGQLLAYLMASNEMTINPGTFSFLQTGIPSIYLQGADFSGVEISQSNICFWWFLMVLTLLPSSVLDQYLYPCMFHRCWPCQFFFK